MNYHNFNIQLKFEFVHSKDMFMWVYYDANGYYPYNYIRKLRDKPTKRMNRYYKRWCLMECKNHQYWEEI